MELEELAEPADELTAHPTEQVPLSCPEYWADDENGVPVSLRSGRFGPYVQLGEEDKASGAKPRRSSLPPDLPPEQVTLETALGLLALPRQVGTHPEDGAPVEAGIGRYGPYVRHGRTYASLEKGDDVLRIGMNRAIELIEDFDEADKPIAAICHGPWLLVEADIVDGRTVTGWPSIRTDLENAGGEVVDQEVAVDGNLITSRKPDDIPAFSRALLAALSD